MIQSVNRQEVLTPLGKSIVKTLVYYDIFNYPLTAEEIFMNLESNHVSISEVIEENNSLYKAGLIRKENIYFMLTDKEDMVNKRLKGNALAEKRLKSAYRMSRIISKFPYIRAILLSGSISKGYMEKESDIDYFIVTEQNRLWFSRLVLMLFKKIFLLNSRKLFCLNYFVDTKTLEIEEKNIFTATEVVTLIPTFGKELYETMLLKNIWVRDFFPNFPKRSTAGLTDSGEKRRNLKLFIEWTLNNSLGDKLDDFAMSLFSKFIHSRYKEYDKKDFKLAFKTSKNESKHHPKFFQKKVLDAYYNKLRWYEETFKVSLS